MEVSIKTIRVMSLFLSIKIQRQLCLDEMMGIHLQLAMQDQKPSRNDCLLQKKEK